MMVGQAVTLNIDRPQPHDTLQLLDVKNLTVRDKNGVTKLDDVSFTVVGGEILGIAGIAGSGQKELLEAIAGLQSVDSGTVEYTPPDSAMCQLVGLDPATIQQMGVRLSFVPEDRLGMGLVANMDMIGNMMLRSFQKSKLGLTDRKSPAELAERVRDELGIVTPGLTTPVRRMSGGNVQKVLVGREIAAAPRVLMTAYAVRGLDINTSYTIYRLLNEQKEKGVGVIFVGEDLDVLLELCDRILVLCGGKVSGILDGRKATREQVGLLMTTVGGEVNA
jgi:simple sugar transport system ATP-binding protein